MLSPWTAEREAAEVAPCAAALDCTVADDFFQVLHAPSLCFRCLGSGPWGLFNSAPNDLLRICVVASTSTFYPWAFRAGLRWMCLEPSSAES